MSEIEKALTDGYAVIIYANRLGTATMTIVDGEDFKAVQEVVYGLPDEQVIDITRPTGPEGFEAGVAKIGRKMRREGEYENWDEKMREFGLPPASERPPKSAKE